MTTPFISVEGLTRRFSEPSGGGELTVFEDLWFDVEERCREFGDEFDPARRCVAVRIAGARGMERLPVPDVGPGHVGGDHGSARRVLHHRVIDRFASHLGESLGIGMKTMAILASASDSLGHSLENRRAMFAQFGQEVTGAEREDAAILRI